MCPLSKQHLGQSDRLVTRRVRRVAPGAGWCLAGRPLWVSASPEGRGQPAEGRGSGSLTEPLPPPPGDPLGCLCPPETRDSPPRAGRRGNPGPGSHTATRRDRATAGSQQCSPVLRIVRPHQPHPGGKSRKTGLTSSHLCVFEGPLRIERSVGPSGRRPASHHLRRRPRADPPGPRCMSPSRRPPSDVAAVCRGGPHPSPPPPTSP